MKRRRFCGTTAAAFAEWRRQRPADGNAAVLLLVAQTQIRVCGIFSWCCFCNAGTCVQAAFPCFTVTNSGTEEQESGPGRTGSCAEAAAAHPLVTRHSSGFSLLISSPSHIYWTSVLSCFSLWFGSVKKLKLSEGRHSDREMKMTPLL